MPSMSNCWEKELQQCLEANVDFDVGDFIAQHPQIAPPTIRCRHASMRQTLMKRLNKRAKRGVQSSSMASVNTAQAQAAKGLRNTSQAQAAKGARNTSQAQAAKGARNTSQAQAAKGERNTSQAQVAKDASNTPQVQAAKGARNTSQAQAAKGARNTSQAQAAKGSIGGTRNMPESQRDKGTVGGHANTPEKHQHATNDFCIAPRLAEFGAHSIDSLMKEPSAQVCESSIMPLTDGTPFWCQTGPFQEIFA